MSYAADTNFKGKSHELELHWPRGCIAESCVLQRNIWVKFNENRSKGSGDMERTEKWRGFSLSIVCCQIWYSNGIGSHLRGYIIWPWRLTLTLSLQTRFMGSAHCPTVTDIWVKLTINRSKGSENIERTQNWRVNPTTLKCDLDLE